MSNHFDDTHPAMSEVSNGVPSGQPDKTTWPTVVGVIGIILASLNILGSICLIAFASNLFAGLLSETDQANLPPAVVLVILGRNFYYWSSSSLSGCCLDQSVLFSVKVRVETS